MKQQKDIETFNQWLSDNGMTNYREYGDFIFDAQARTWCKRGTYRIFNGFETVKATINKNKSSTSSTKNNSSYSTYSSVDTSTFEVYIETTDINYPVVKIQCGQSMETAEKIRATVNILCKQKGKHAIEELNG